MSDTDDDFDDDAGTDAGGDANGPKALRAELKKLKLKQAELETENATFKKAQRTQTVAQALEAHGANPRLAKFYDKTEASSDDVLEWLKENGEDLGWSPDGGDDDDDAETVEQAGRIGRATASAPQKSVGKQITPEFIRTAPREELVKLGILRA